MKTKTIVFILFCLIISEEGYAQTWPMPGANWQYSQPETGYLRNFAYTKDTTINGTSYQVIEQTNLSSWNNVGSVYTRYSNDTVYRYVQSKEYPFLVFFASVNDIYTSFRTDFSSFADSVCSSILPVKVLQLNTISIGSLNLEKWNLEDTLCDDIFVPFWGGPNFSWEVVERIGLMNDFPFAPNVYMPGNCSFFSEPGNGYYLCNYSDSSFSYSVPCAVGISEQTEKQEIKLYPNPASDILNFSTEGLMHPIEIRLFDLLGREVDKKYFFTKNFNISLTSVPAGFYLIKCSTPFYTQTTSLIINH